MPDLVRRYAYKIAHLLYPKVAALPHVDLEDLVQVALEAYCRDCRTRKDTPRRYLWIRMKGHVLDFIRDQFVARGGSRTQPDRGPLEMNETEFWATQPPEVDEEDEIDPFAGEAPDYEALITRKWVLDFVAEEFGPEVVEKLIFAGTKTALAEAVFGKPDHNRGWYFMERKLLPAVRQRFPELFVEEKKDGH